MLSAIFIISYKFIILYQHFNMIRKVKTMKNRQYSYSTFKRTRVSHKEWDIRDHFTVFLHFFFTSVLSCKFKLISLFVKYSSRYTIKKLNLMQKPKMGGFQYFQGCFVDNPTVFNYPIMFLFTRFGQYISSSVYYTGFSID